MDNETAIRLIEIYGSFNALWDTRRKEYHNNNLREDMWDEIAKNFEQPKAVLKTKMKSLLSSYRRERNREKTSNITGSDRNKAYKSKWFAYESFHFLHDRGNPIDTVDCGSSSQSHNTEQGATEQGATEQGATEQSATEQGTSELNTTNMNTASTIPTKRKPTKRTHEDPEYDAENKMLEDALEEMRKQSDNSNDLYVAFGMHVAAELRKYDPITLARVKHSINTIIFDADMACINQLNQSTIQENDERRPGYFTTRYTDISNTASSSDSSMGSGLTQLINDLNTENSL
ncbi:uncharacterized protein [Maniola hyperantus]|uniref:uncharacterized protein n=1 Tax=Aphantopus hyperantus TaxID=2795564 RepID=UPI00156920F5|nr:uncharacterized protein LOC117994165 [Maniola hyperantus]